MDKELLVEYGIDYDKGVSNCMDDSDFFQTLLSMFLNDDCFRRAQKAYESRNYKELFSCMHELKGVSGNAALNNLYGAIAPLVEVLRHGASSDAAVDRLFSAVEAAYQRTCEGITLAINK